MTRFHIPISRLLLLSFLFVLSNNSSSNVEQCQKVDPHCESFLGTKVPYRVVANLHDKVVEYPGCEPLRIIGVIRHGTRTPGKKFNDKVNRLASLRDLIFEKNDHNKNREIKLCDEEEERLRKWKWINEFKGEKWLTHEGEDEMVELAERIQNRFPSLLNRNYSNNTFLFQSTSAQRAIESARHFTIGLFGRKESQHIWFPKPVHKDPILRFYKRCDRWKEEVKKNSTTYSELEKFKFHPDVSASIERVSKVLGIPLTYDDVHMMYITCSFETAWRKNYRSPWCSIFSRNDLKVFEYAEDLKYYWRDGYGFKLNHEQACPAIKDFFSHFKGMKHENVFYFTHSGTLLKLLSHFGIYRDTFVLKSDTPNFQKEQRKWKVSQIDAFGTNIVFVTFNCSRTLKILTLHQEKPVIIPGCPKDNSLCPLNLLEDLFKKSLDCNFDNMCTLL